MAAALRAVAALGLCGLVATACSDPDASNSEDIAPLSFDVSSLLDDAREGGAGQKQREAMEAAHAHGEMTLDVVEDLFVDYARCLEEAGFTVEITAPFERFPGFFEPDAHIRFPPGLSTEQADDLDLRCARQHYLFANSYYVSQPVAFEAYLATFDQQRQAIVECLAEFGVVVAHDASSTELLYAVSETRLIEGVLCWEGQLFGGYLHPDSELNNRFDDVDIVLDDA